MPPTSSTMLPLGTPASDFSLPSAGGGIVSLSDFSGAKALLMIFACNHCPFVVHVRSEIAKLHADYSERGVGLVVICSNDSDESPADSFECMKAKAEEWAWKMPYLHDETQSVAKAYKAACTPDCFLFDGDMKLAYRGQLDESRPNNGKPVNGADIRHALDAMLAGETPREDQKPSVGCNIKWKSGGLPEYA